MNALGRVLRGTTDGDEGTTLVLALIFLSVVGLLGGALAAYADSTLSQTSSFSGERARTYAAESAIQVAVQQVRNISTYATAPGYGAGTSCPETDVTIAENGVNEALAVFCVVGQAQAPFQRAITFAACPSGTAAASCINGAATFTPSLPKTSPVLAVATATYDDLRNGCSFASGPLDPCLQIGSRVDVSNWDVTGANGTPS